MKPINQLVVLSLTGLLLGVTGAVLADRDHEDDEDHGLFHRWFGNDKPAIAAVESQLYREECGSCHFPYQPGLLPAASWERMLTTLDDHFGENAELPEESLEPIRNHLFSHSAGRVDDALPRRISVSLREAQPPMRITETRFFRHEHDEIPNRLVTENPQVGSFSNCDACHRHAIEGSFNEHEVRIPGYGHWDD